MEIPRSHLEDTSPTTAIWRIPLTRPAQDIITARVLAQALFSKAKERKPSAVREQDRRFAIASEHVVAAKALSNCHTILYTGEIQLGTPGQTFVVGFDTSSFDLWVPSDRCEASCESHVWRRYTESKSSTVKPVTEEEKGFNQLFGDLEYMEGEHVKDALDLGNGLVIDDQVFVQITTFGRMEMCQGQEGMLGLGNSDYTEFDFPSVTSNLKTVLNNPIFSMFLDELDDDYPEDPGPPERDASLGPGHAYDGANPDDYRPTSSHSEIVFGGVNHQHYSGCLHWHDVAEVEGESSLWAFHIHSVQSNGEELSGDTTMAVIDTESSFVAGPASVLGPYLANNDVECFDMDPFGEAFLVACDGMDGFQAAAIDCDANIDPLQFTADGATYELSVSDLSTRVATSEGDVCLLRLITLLGDDQTWVFGDAFVNRYYTAFDFGRGRIGLAPKTLIASNEKCPEDWPLDINYDDVPLAPSTAASPSPVATIAKNPVQVAVAPIPAPNKPISTLDQKTPLTPHTKNASQVAAPPSSSNNVNLAAIGLPAFLIVGAMLMVLLISRRRSNSYRRADRYAGGDDYDDEVELPGLL